MKTRETIKSLLEFNSTLSNSELASILNMTPQGVHHHTKNMIVDRTGRKFLSCTICGIRIKSRNKDKMCLSCKKLTNSYEFVCAFCGRVNVVTGLKASSRKRNQKNDPNKLDYCSQKCSGKHIQNRYWALRKLANL